MVELEEDHDEGQLHEHPVEIHRLADDDDKDDIGGDNVESFRDERESPGDRPEIMQKSKKEFPVSLALTKTMLSNVQDKIQLRM